MEFFGVPIKCTILKQSPPEIVVVCLEHLDEECRKRVTECSKKWDSGGVQKFYKELAMLEESIQDKCLDAILDKLTTMSGERAKLVKKTLEKGNTRTSVRNFRTRSSCCCSFCSFCCSCRCCCCFCCWHCCYVDNLLHVIRRLPSNNFFFHTNPLFSFPSLSNSLEGTLFYLLRQREGAKTRRSGNHVTCFS